MLLDIYDPLAPPTPLGIDLGTTHSTVAYVRDDRPVSLTTCDGTALLPSVVHYGEHGHVVVGKAAQGYLTRDPAHTVSSVKRFMGRGADDAETKRLGAWKFVAPANAEEARVVRFDFGARTATPVEVSAEILKSLRQSAIDQLTQIGGVVVTVPAYFDDAQRQATRDAGKLAGLDVVRLLNEPTAAALAYGLDKKKNGTFAVYDLGGGTFDITILLLDEGVFQVKSTGGDSALGGDDMDRLIAERMLQCMGSVSESQRTPEVVALALDAARQVKHQLTEHQEVRVELPKQGGGTVEFELTRAEFDALIDPLLQRTGRACKRALRDAGLSPNEIDGVILVGGATRVPRVKTYVESIFKTAPLSDLDPDQVVAYGAALQAQMLADSSDEVLLLDVLPLSLGVEAMGGVVEKILPRNTAIPTAAAQVFTTYADNQTGFELHVVQGERELAEDCRSLARFSLKGIPAMPAGMARLEVTFHVDENNLLTVTAEELSTGKKQVVEVKPSYGLSEEQIEEMLISALDHGEEDFERRALADARVEGQRILLSTKKSLAEDSDLLEETERALVSRSLEELEAAIASAKNAALVQAKIDALDEATHAWAGRRMNRAIKRAISGKALSDVAATVEHAKGVDAHVEQHKMGRGGTG